MPIENRNLGIGTRLVANYKKQAYVCIVEAGEAEGEIAFVLEGGKRFKSPSAAAMAVMDGKAVNGWRFWSVEGLAVAAEPAKPKTKAKKAKTKGLLSKIPPHPGDAEGSSRYWCSACMGSFLAEGETRPETCPEGHRADDPELTAPVAAEVTE